MKFESIDYTKIKARVIKLKRSKLKKCNNARIIHATVIGEDDRRRYNLIWLENWRDPSDYIYTPVIPQEFFNEAWEQIQVGNTIWLFYSPNVAASYMRPYIE